MVRVKQTRVNVLDELKLPYILAIAPQSCVATPRQRGGATTLANRRSAPLAMAQLKPVTWRSVIYGQRHRQQYWLLTTEEQNLK